MKYYLFIIICLIYLPVKAQKNEDKIIELPNLQIHIDSLVNFLANQHNIYLSYNNRLIKVSTLKFNSYKVSVIDILENIGKTSNLNYQIQGNKVVFYPKKKKYILSGIVSDAETGDPLEGVNVYKSETNKGCSTDKSGFFRLSLESKEEHEIIFSYIGYKTLQSNFFLTTDSIVNIYLNVDYTKLKDVKILSPKKIEQVIYMGKSVGNIDLNQIESQTTNNPADILQARIPGVWSIQTSGSPGHHQKIGIRGVNSLFGLTDPLFVIDGIPIPVINQRTMGISDINIHDIEKITVLKDAASTAIYGFQGSNGVIIVETKRSDRNQLSFSIKTGIQRIQKKYDLMGTKEYLAALDSSSHYSINNMRSYCPEYNDTLTNRDWQKALFRDGYLREYQLSGTGRIEKMDFYFSGNIYKHDGILQNSSYNKYSFYTNLKRNITRRLSADLGARFSFQNNVNNLDFYNGNNMIIEGINKPPLLKNIDNNYPLTYIEYPSLSKRDDPDSIFRNASNELKAYSGNLSLSFKYELFNNLKLNGFVTTSGKYDYYYSDLAKNIMDTISNNVKSHEDYITNCQQLNLIFNQSIAKNQFIITGGFRNYIDHINWNLQSANNKDIDNQYLNNSLAFYGDQGYINRNLLSFYAQLLYNYDNKYFLSFSSNYETYRTSGYLALNKYFPSIAVVWDVSKEYGLKDLLWLTKLNFSFNWGKASNYPLNAVFLNFLSKTEYFYFDNNFVPYTTSPLYQNNFIRPEKNTEYSLAGYISLFKDRIRFNMSYYFKTSKDLIIQKDIAAVFGADRSLYNIARLSNNGKEFTLETDIIRSRNFIWQSNFSLFLNKQKVEKLTDNTSITFSSQDLLFPEFMLSEGKDVGLIKGYKYLGLWTKADEVSGNTNYVNRKSGKYLNSVPDLYLRYDDQVVIGKSLPDYIWQWNNIFVVKNWSLEVLWYAVMGQSKFNSTRAATYITGTNKETTKFLKSNTYVLTDSMFYRSSYFVEDASFIKLKSISLSYQINKKVLKVADVIISFSLQNLLTITKYSGYDPEASIYTENSFSDYGVDRGAYPNPRSAFLGIKVNF